MMLILLAVLVTSYEVFMRYALGRPTTWAYKYTLWLGAIVYLASGIFAMQRRRHIRITTVYNSVPRRVRILFDYLTLFVIVVYATLMIVGGADPARAAFLDWIRSGQLSNPSVSGTIKPLVLITTALVVIVAINNLLVDYCGYGKEHRRQTSGDDA